MSTNGFNPDIVAFCCRHCAYAAADLAGSMRLDYPTSIKVVELPCTGKLDVLYVLRAFEQGADGVYQVACPMGNCHHVRGNERGLARIQRAKQILDEIGLGGERLDMFFMSGSQGQTFAMAAQTMTERVRKLGPNPLKGSAEPKTMEKALSAEENGEDNGFRGRRT